MLALLAIKEHMYLCVALKVVYIFILWIYQRKDTYRNSALGKNQKLASQLVPIATDVVYKIMWHSKRLQSKLNKIQIEKKQKKKFELNNSL